MEKLKSKMTKKKIKWKMIERTFGQSFVSSMKSSVQHNVISLKLLFSFRKIEFNFDFILIV